MCSEGGENDGSEVCIGSFGGKVIFVFVVFEIGSCGHGLAWLVVRGCLWVKVFGAER